ncbi:MAG: GspE/PulE family protein [Terrimicrobiaceae bacterium]|nr:GspE/PulE family protein [Terrimicrobiaceae bacterium]
MVNLVEDLVEIARTTGCPDSERCREFLLKAANSQRSLVSSLLDGEMVREPEFLEELAQKLDLPWRAESDVQTIENVREKFPARLALGLTMVPEAATDGGELRLLTFDPFDHAGWQAVVQHWGGPVRLVMTTRRRLRDTLKTTYGVGADTFEELIEGRENETGGTQEESHDVDEEDSEASVMKFVNQILREGLQQGATDIHFEPLGQDLRIRYRIDGMLHETPVPPRIKVLQDSVVSRLKIMAGLDIAERRLPQDGRIALEHSGRPIDVRVATIPSVYGENVSLRLLGQERFDFARLGLDGTAEKRIRTLLSLPNGIVLVTGPTGCGKSTSLYTFLSALNVKERRIVTIEDPVEHKLDGVIQIAVKPEIQLTFANALRSILRGDPNVIMVGEMRDFETAEIAIRAALTGHLVFSTLHTNDAVGGITRLLDMNIEPFLVGSSVRAFIAQRLVRRLCKHCSQPAHFKAEELTEIGFPLEFMDRIRRPVGCERCRHSGYAGRTALFEICMMTARIQELIQRRATGPELREVAMREGMVPLRKDGWQKVADGVTSIEEVLRVTTSELEVLDE